MACSGADSGPVGHAVRGRRFSSGLASRRDMARLGILGPGRGMLGLVHFVGSCDGAFSSIVLT